MESVAKKVELRGLAGGLWIWRAEYPGWKPDADLQPVVKSTIVESGGERLPEGPPKSQLG